MARRYFFEWYDTENTLYRVDISSDLYTGSEIEINGYATIAKSWKLWQPIKSTAIDLKMIATTAVPLEDIYEENDRYWSVILYKDTVEQFRGSIQVQEVEQPFIADVWEISVEVIDALGFLEDLSFVDTGGLNWTGSDTVINTIAKAVKRGFRDQTEAFNILANTGFTLSDNSVFQENAYVEMNAFLDDNEEPNSCKEVVEQMLEAMGCVIFQYLGDWVIVNVENWIGLYSAFLDYREYDEDGTYLSASSWAYDTTNRDIGSEINAATIFHVNKNQSYITKAYLQATRIKHEYEYRDQIIPNGELIAAGAGPYTMPDWTLTSDAEAFVNGLLVDGIELAIDEQDGAISTPIRIVSGNSLKLTLSHEYVDDPIKQGLTFKLTDGVTTYYFSKRITQTNGEWVLAGSSHENFYFSSGVDGIEEGSFTHTIEMSDFPIDGNFQIIYRTPIYGGAHTANSKVVVTGVLAEAIEDEKTGIEFTGERTDDEFGSIDDPIEIRFATANTSIIKNTFFDSTGDLIEEVKFNASAANDSLYFLIESMMNLKLGRTSVFSGDVKGDVELMTPKKINTFDDVFLLGQTTKDLRNDVTNVEFLGTNNVSGSAVVDITNRVVYKDTIKPKIK